MPKTWAISFGESERMELERIVMDEDPGAAFEFVRKVVYAKVKESEKPGSCFHDTSQSVEDVPREIKKHKDLGSAD